ncbi:N-acetyltransferase family protein [Arthrobacter sp. KK5.5]|uniref:GNAT family N-acetyltransferase n=1 Tax=Arthrobacter sp. KK5.5 TaxID=3373084 RepID=UPI003EE64F6F
MNIRLATHHDAPQLAELLKPWTEHRAESERYARRRGPTGPGTHVAERDGAIVGWLNGSHVNKNADQMADYKDRADWRCSVLAAMYVSVDHQKDGAGTALVEAFLAESEDTGNTMAYVHPDASVGADLERLRGFYANLGFSVRQPEGRTRMEHWPMARDIEG